MFEAYLLLSRISVCLRMCLFVYMGTWLILVIPTCVVCCIYRQFVCDSSTSYELAILDSAPLLDYPLLCGITISEAEVLPAS